MSAHLATRGVLAAALFTCVALASAAPASSAANCDSACLTGLATQYMDALASEHWRDLPWADTVHYAENSVKMMVGDGTWATATAHSATPLIVADPVAGKVAWIGTIDEHGQPGFYALELDAKGDKIAAVQSVIRRKEGRPPFGDPVTFTHAPLFTEPLAPDDATDRDAMIGLANSYFAEQAGGARTVPVAFANGCRLIENGVPMTGNLPAVKGETGDCARAFHRGLFQEYESVRHRIVAVDPARGLVVAIGYRDMPAADIKFEATDGKPYLAEAEYPRSMGFMSVFRIENGAIASVETVASELPYMMPFPW
jgi:hypothetical protein